MLIVVGCDGSVDVSVVVDAVVDDVVDDAVVAVDSVNDVATVVV